MMGELIHGDCLDVMRGMDAGSVDLIYADPPYCTGRDWGEFDDRWESFEVYLAYMEERLKECHRVLVDTGSFYLHVDPNISHYLKVMLDGIFGCKNFRNEIVWLYHKWPAKGKDFVKSHDSIFRYAGDNRVFNIMYGPRRPSTEKRTKGRVWHRQAGESRAQVLDSASPGSPLRDVWDISIEPPNSSNRTSYPTQKPITLLKRIIQASSNADDIVLDPFCGSGTTLAAAQLLGRKWIGIDQNPNAIELCEKRLSQTQPALIAA